MAAIIQPIFFTVMIHKRGIWALLILIIANRLLKKILLTSTTQTNYPLQAYLSTVKVNRLLAIVGVNDDGEIVYGSDIGAFFFEPERRNNFLRGVWSYSCYPVNYVNADNKRIEGTEFIFIANIPKSVKQLMAQLETQPLTVMIQNSSLLFRAVFMQLAGNFTHDTFNFSATKLNDGNFIFGKYGGYLCKTQGNTYQVFINAGHGGKDSGAVGYGLKESDVAYCIAARVATYLSKFKLAAKVFQYDGLEKICATANQWDADLFISFHCNAFNGSANGTETFHFYNSV